jgi:hypothetical protein
MSAPRILDLIKNCGESPNRVYYSGGVYNCSLVGESVGKDGIPSFCPLSTFPSQEIANLERTVQALRKSDSSPKTISEVIILFLSNKLNLLINAGGGITIGIYSDHRRISITSISVSHYTITEINLIENILSIKCGVEFYRLSLNTDKSDILRGKGLMKKVEIEGREGWEEVYMVPSN